MTPGTRLRLRIDKPAAGGRMIGRHDGAIVLVSRAIPGELVDAVVEKVQRGTIWAAAVDVLEPSPDRLADAGDGACGGNVYAHIADARQRQLKADIVRDAFARIGRLNLAESLDVVASPPEGYRMRARLHVVQGRIGFFREGTHDLCPPEATGQLTQDTVAAIGRIEAALRRTGDVREVEIAENCPGDERALHLIIRRGAPLRPLRGLPPIPGIRGLSAGADGDRPAVVSGKPDVADVVAFTAAGKSCEMTLVRRAHAFFQANRFLLAPLVSAVADAVRRGPVLDLYAGVGLFSVALARCGYAVVAIEGEESSAADLVRNAVQTNGALQPHRQAVETYVEAPHGPAPSTIVVDPPRTGMSRRALAGALRLAAERLVYVSCDVATLARDARAIVDSGYAIRLVRAFDLFPRTAHVETLVVFDRSGG
jgi:23S rRNA (uracil1939-C5)-methyltransferase